MKRSWSRMFVAQVVALTKPPLWLQDYVADATALDVIPYASPSWHTPARTHLRHREADLVEEAAPFNSSPTA